MPVKYGGRGSHGPEMSDVPFAGNLATGSEGIRSLRDFIEQQLHSLDGDVLKERAMEIKGQLFVEALRIQIAVKGHGSAIPGVGKLTTGQRKPFVVERIVSDIAPIHSNGLPIKGIGEGLIGGSGVTLRTGSQEETTLKVVIQTALHAKASAKAGAIAVKTTGTTGVILEETFTADSHVTGKTKASKQTFYGRDPLL